MLRSSYRNLLTLLSFLININRYVMICSGLAAEQTVLSQVLNLRALTGQGLKSGLWLNVEILKDNQCFISCGDLY